MFRPSDLSKTERKTDNTPVVGTPEAEKAVKNYTNPRPARPPLSPCAQKNRNTSLAITGISAAALIASGVIVSRIDRGPQAPDDGIRLTDETKRKVYNCLKEYFFLKSEQDLLNSTGWLDESCRNSDDPQTRDYMERVDGSSDPLDTAARLRDALLLEIGISPGEEDGRPGLVQWISSATNLDTGSPITIMGIADPKKAQEEAEKGHIVLTYVDGNGEK